MAVSEQTPYIEYTANGIAKNFALEFDCENQDHLIVLVDDVEPVVGTWSLSDGAVVFGTAPINGKKITIQRNTPFRRDGDFQSYDNSFRPAPVNKGFDKIWWKIQELGVADWLLGLKIQKFRDDVNLTALEETLEQSQELRDSTAVLAGEVENNVAQSQTLLADTISKANEAEASATAASTANTAAQQAVVQANAAEGNVYAALTAQTNTVNTALVGFTNGAAKFYPTLADANTDIANIGIKDKVEVGEAVNGGAWYKATAGATSLTKSPYDPIEQAKNYANANALFKPRRLTLDENIDSLQDGIYIIPSAAVSSSLVGLPANMKTPKIGYLFSYVAGGGVAFQHIVHYAETTVEEWKRVGNGSSTAFAWKAWQKELELADITGYQGFLWGRPSSINFDNVNLKLIIGSETRAVYDNTSTLLPPQEIAYPTGGTYNIVLNKTTKLLSFKLTSAGVVNGEVIVGSWFSTGYVVGGIDAYTVNGANGDKRVFTGEIIGDAENINFDLINNQLIIPANLVRALVGNNTTFALAQTVPLPVDNYWYRIVFDPTSRLISFARTSVVLAGEQVQVGEFDSRNRKVYGIVSYSINGNPATAGSSDLLTSELIVINGNTDAGYIQETELSGYAGFLSTAIHSDVYALYDNLVAQYPEYVSRSLLSNDTTGKPVYCYDFKAPEVVAETHSGYLPKMILVSGVHGFEKSGTMNLYNTLKTICEQWGDDERLEALRWNCHFIVVPLAVPSGFDSNIRHNANGVDIARNFPSDWEQGVVGDITYGGTAPLSEVESQYINDLISSNKDAIYFMSHHNFGSSDPARFVWNASATRFGVRLGKMLINRLTHSLEKRYPWVGQYPNYIGISNINSPNGSEGKHATKAHGVQGGTFEIGNNLQFAPDTSQYSSLVATIGVEILVNWLLLNLEYGSQLYNSKINL